MLSGITVKSILRKFNLHLPEKVCAARVEFSYLRIVGIVVELVHAIRDDYGTEPEVLVLGRSDYSDLVRYYFAKNGDTPGGIVREFMGLRVVVLPNITRLVDVSPSLEDLCGIRVYN